MLHAFGMKEEPAGLRGLAPLRMLHYCKYIRGEKTKPSAPTKSPKAKRRLSAAGRAAIIAATKKRWALKRAAAKH
jgi:hypothetical protein